MKIKTLIYIAILTACAILVWRQPPAEAPQGHELTIQTGHGTVIFHVDIAKTRQEKEVGLMKRTSLPERYGMLFLWPRERPVEMWMKDTLIPLDMLFINREGHIVYIAHSAAPESLETITAPQPVMAVLELAGGTAKANRIEAGNQVIHSAFKR